MHRILILAFCIPFIGLSSVAAQYYFNTDSAYDVGSSPRDIISADFNGDSHPDIAVTNYNDNDISILLNQGNGYFLSEINYGVGQYPDGIFAADFDNDSDVDLAIANHGPDSETGSVSILLNNSSGEFALTQTLLSSRNVLSIHGGDFDLDGDIDLCCSSTDSIFIFRNNGNSSFSKTRLLGGELSIYCTTIGNDSLPDIAGVSASTLNYIDLWTNSGNCTFSNRRLFLDLYRPSFVIATDINDDDSDDLIFAHNSIRRISICTNDGDGQFITSAGFQIGSKPNELSCIDFNNDGMKDMAITSGDSNKVMILFSQGNYSFLTVEQIRDAGGPIGLCSADFDNDGDIDIAWAASAINKVVIAKNYFGDTSIASSINGHVYDAASLAPVESTRVTALLSGRSALSSGVGEYSIDSLLNRRQDFLFSHPSYIDTIVKSITCQPDSSTYLDMALHPTGWISGTVRDTLNRPLRGAEVRIVGTSNISISNNDGEFIIKNLHDGNYNLACSLYSCFNDTISVAGITEGDTIVQDIYLTPRAYDIEIFYGNSDGSPIWARPGQIVYVNVFAKTKPDVYGANLHLCLGTQNRFIDSLCSSSFGSFYPFLSQWEFIEFLEPQHSPPNIIGWSSQSILGFASLFGGPNPWFHFPNTSRITTMAIRVVNDSSLLGDTIACLGFGKNEELGYSHVGDTTTIIDYAIVEHFSPIYFTLESPPCNYLPGDINGDSSVIGADVTYGVRYFKGTGNPPPDSCYMDSSGNNVYVSGDVNGNCEFRGSDITRLVSFFKNATPISYCHWFPLSNRR
jgi:hypothetical protein